MSNDQNASEEPSFAQGDHTQRPGKPKARKPSRQVNAHARSTMSQVTVSVEREVLAGFDQLSAETGVNRQHLMREALGMYAALLASGHRVYAVPGLLRRVA